MPLSPDDRFSALLGRREESGWLPDDDDEELAAPSSRPVPTRRVLWLVVVLTVLGIAGFVAYHQVRARVTDQPADPAPVSQIAGAAANGGAATPGTVLVHVVGQVRRPGVVALPAGSRVADALAAAGGLKKGADAAAVNQARVVVDGEQIVVPARTARAPAGSAAATGAAPGQGSAAKVDINTADVAALDTLPGVGPVTAQAIVSYREEHGRFASVDALTEVSGIGPATLEKLRPLVTV